ncbi:MAG TPA: hypothetical protein VGC32_15710 [Solirubrobacterales bacterium]
MKPVSVLSIALVLLGIAVSAPAASAAPGGAGKAARPNCKVLPGTDAGTECVYATTEETANDYGIAGTVSTAFAETPKQWNAYRASAKQYPGLEPTSFQPLKLGGGNESFALHQDNSGTGVPDVYYLYVFTPQHNIFSIDFLNGVTLKTEEGLAREISGRLDGEWHKAR